MVSLTTQPNNDVCRQHPPSSPSFEEDPSLSEVEYSEESETLRTTSTGASTSSEEVDRDTSASEDSESPSKEGDGRPPPFNSSDTALPPPPSKQSKLLASSSDDEEDSESSQSKSSSEVDGPRDDHLFLELSEKTEKGREKAVMEIRSTKKRKTEQANDVILNPYKYLTILIEKLDDQLEDAGKKPWMKDQMMDLDPEVLLDLEKKCLAYCVNEAKVVQSRHEFLLEVLKAIQEEMAFYPSVLYSHLPTAVEADSDISSTLHQVQPAWNGNHKNDSSEEQHSNLNDAPSSNQ